MALEKVGREEAQRAQRQPEPTPEPEPAPTSKGGPAVRVVMTLPPDVAAQLDTLADGPRFNGNRSMAAAWCVSLGAVVLTDSKVRDRLFVGPADAMKAFTSR